MSSVFQTRLLSATLYLFISLLSVDAASIRFLPWDNDVAARKIGFFNGVDVAEIQNLHPDKRSKPVSWTGSEVPPQLVAMDRNDPEGKPLGVPLKITAGMEKPLVIILPDPSQPSGLRCYVIDDGAGKFGWGVFRFINATGKELLIRNDKVTKALPKTWNPVDLDPGGAARNMGIQMAARDNLAAVLYSAVWEYDPNVRKLIIVVPGVDVDGGAVNLKIIPEDRRSAGTPAPVTAAETP